MAAVAALVPEGGWLKPTLILISPWVTALVTYFWTRLGGVLDNWLIDLQDGFDFWQMKRTLAKRIDNKRLTKADRDEARSELAQVERAYSELQRERFNERVRARHRR